jgi:ribosomal protein L14E/L6E/L27E
MELKRGQVVRSLAGHDKGDFQTILELEGNMAILCDGKRRSLEKPKRKKLIHLAPTATVLDEESLRTNRQIRNALRPFREKAQ